MAESQRVGGVYYDVDMNTSKLLEGERKVNGSLSNMTASVKPLVIALAGIGVALSAVAVASSKAADNMRLLASRVEIAAGSVAAGTEAFNQLYRISRETNGSLEANASVFSRLNQSMLQMGGTQQDTIRLTEILSKSMKVSGASAAEASSAMLQFGQALGSGKLQGDELRSLLESAPTLMRSLADGIGVPVSALRKMGEEGKLTSDVVVQALGKAADQIDRDFQKIPQTLEATTDSMVDALMRLNKNFDDVTGTSAALTGVMDGLGDVLDMVAGQIGDVDKESDTLNRKNLVKGWADATVKALSYVADAGDFVIRGFRQIGTALGGLTAAAAQAVEGNFAGAKEILKLLPADIAKINSTMLSGQKIRQAQEALALPGAGGMDAKDRNIAQSTDGGFGRGIKPSAATGDKKKTGGAKFDSQGYINDLVIANADGLAKIDAQEKDALDKAKKLLDEKKISQQQYEQAVTLIRLAASKDREEIQQRERDDLQDWLDEQLKMEEEAAKKRQEAFENARSTADPLAALRAEYEAKLALFDEYQAQLLERGITAETDQQAARTAITAEYEAQRQALAEQTFRSQSEANAFLMDSLDSLSSTATSAIGGLIDGTMTGKDAMIALGRTIRDQAIQALVEMGIQYVKNLIIGQTASAAAVATAAATGAGIATAYAPAAAMASLATLGANAIPAAAGISSTVGLASTLALAGGRQYGGAVAADSLYRVNETGAPEMFTASNGRQYMMPNTRGEVTPANKLGGGVSVVVNNYASGVDVSATQTSDGNVEVTVQRAVAEVASQIASNSGQVWSAMKGATNVQSKL